MESYERAYRDSRTRVQIMAQQQQYRDRVLYQRLRPRPLPQSNVLRGYEGPVAQHMIAFIRAAVPIDTQLPPLL
jgi:hypothetical protein